MHVSSMCQYEYVFIVELDHRWVLSRVHNIMYSLPPSKYLTQFNWKFLSFYSIEGMALTYVRSLSVIKLKIKGQLEIFCGQQSSHYIFLMVSVTSKQNLQKKFASTLSNNKKLSRFWLRTKVRVHGICKSHYLVALIIQYRKLWLLGACAYNFWRNIFLKLTLFIKLMRLINKEVLKGK